MSKPRRGVGGAAQRENSRSVGSSPAVSIKETRIAVLRRMLRDRDRKLSASRFLSRFLYVGGSSRRDFIRLDGERLAIRERIKALSYARKTNAGR